MWEFALPFARGSQRKRAGLGRATGLGGAGRVGIAGLLSARVTACAPQALNSICNVGGKEFAEALSNDVLKLLTANLTKSYVRKKSALTTLRLYRKSADALPAAEWADKILSLLDEKNIGVLTSITSLILGVVSASGPAGWENAAPKAARTLTRLVLNKDYSNDYLYYGIPTPWLQVKLLRMLQFFPAPEEHALKMRVTEVLQRIVSGTDVTKNVNKNNATHAVLFEAINLVIHLGSSTELLGQASLAPHPRSRRPHFRGQSAPARACVTPLRRSPFSAGSYRFAKPTSGTSASTRWRAYPTSSLRRWRP